MRFELNDNDIEKIKKQVSDGTGFTWRERLAIGLTLKVIIWLTEGTSLFCSDLANLKTDIFDGLKINSKKGE